MLTSPKQLNYLLSKLKSENFVNLSDIDIDELIDGMLENIGSTDPKLRDELIYESFYYLSLKTHVLDNKYRHILQVCIDNNHLFYKIGENGTDSIFTRTFSVLVLPLIIFNHRKYNIFTREEIINIYQIVKKYFLEEQDLRGYVPEKGWAHSVAHTSDAIDELALCSELEQPELQEMLNLIKAKINNSDFVFVNQEDERMVTAIVSIFNRHLLSDEDIIQWITSFGNYHKTGQLYQDLNLKVNIKNLFRSLYFRLLPLNEFTHFNQEILSILNSL